MNVLSVCTIVRLIPRVRTRVDHSRALAILVSLDLVWSAVMLTNAPEISTAALHSADAPIPEALLSVPAMLASVEMVFLALMSMSARSVRILAASLLVLA